LLERIVARHLLTRVMHDRVVADAATLRSVAAALRVVATRTIELPATHNRAARRAVLSLRFGCLQVVRPRNMIEGGGAAALPRTVPLMLVDAIEQDPPPGIEPVHWQLLTTHAVGDAAAAWQIVDWYKLRWTIEQLFRLTKSHGLQIADSQRATADGLMKLAAIALEAAAVILQLVQARQGAGGEPAGNAFTEPEIAVLTGLNAKLEEQTARLKNPHPRNSLARAAWVIARIGGWNGYPSSRPPGPITLRHGPEYFHALVAGWTLRDVCIPWRGRGERGRAERPATILPRPACGERGGVRGFIEMER